MSHIRKAIAALAVVLAATGAAQANPNDFYQHVEGISGISFSPKVDASMSWSRISRLAYPDFPTIRLQNGDHRVDHLCVDGSTIRPKKGRTAEVCEVWVEGSCGLTRRVALGTPIDYTVKVCVASHRETLDENFNQSGRPWTVEVCDKHENVKASHKLAYNVDVRSAPQYQGEGDTNGRPGQLLFRKVYAIEACK